MQTGANNVEKEEKRHLPLAPLTKEVLSEAGDEDFCVQYALEVLLWHGNLRSGDIEVLLEKLVDLWKFREVRSSSAELDALTEELPFADNCNDGTEALKRVRCNALN